MELLNEQGKPLKGSHILMLGMAYKRDVDDLRESPAIKVARLLQARGAELSYHDPYVPGVEIDGRKYRSVNLTPEVLERSDLILITTDHSNVDYSTVVEHAELIYDTRNALKGYTSSKIHKLGAP